MPVLESKPVVEEGSPVLKTDLFKDLKDFRLMKSREEEIRAYYIFNDKQLNALIQRMPQNKDELQLVEGFGVTKVKKYGDDIVSIIQKY